MTQSTPIDPSRCPLCGGTNQCAMEIARKAGGEPGACWCAGMDFTAQLLARVPPAVKNKACICAACAAADRPSRASTAQPGQPG